jgi:CMP-N-acetylneuraminic acid synthetase
LERNDGIPLLIAAIVVSYSDWTFAREPTSTKGVVVSKDLSALVTEGTELSLHSSATLLTASAITQAGIYFAGKIRSAIVSR